MVAELIFSAISVMIPNTVILNYVFMQSNIVSIGDYKTKIVIDSGEHRRFLASYSTEHSAKM